MRTLTFSPILGAALLIPTISASHAAEKIQVDVGGTYQQYFGYANNEADAAEDFTGFDAKADNEIVFSGETTLDNGMSVGLEVVLKAESAGTDQIDGTYLWNEGTFGRFELGQLDNTAAALHVAAPDVGFGLNDTDIGDWIVNPSGGNADSGFSSTYLYLGEDQATKLSWTSPRFAGLQLGLSYIPEFERDDNTQPNGDAAYRDGYSVGLNYSRQFGESTEFTMSAGYLAANRPRSITGAGSAEGYSVGFNLTVDGFTVGGSYASTDGTPAAGTDTANSLDGSGFDLGVSYAFDALAVSLSYYKGEVADAVATLGDSTNESVMASVRFEMGPGVTSMASLFHSRYRADTGVKNEGVALMAGMILEF
jgi:outer membrane protein OmpU